MILKNKSENTVIGCGYYISIVWTQLAVDYCIDTRFGGIFDKSIFGLAIDAALKSAVFLILGLAVLYKMKVSASVNDLVDRVLGSRKISLRKKS